MCNVVDLVLSAMFNINGDDINFDISKLYTDTGLINSGEWHVLKNVMRCVFFYVNGNSALIRGAEAWSVIDFVPINVNFMAMD